MTNVEVVRLSAANMTRLESLAADVFDNPVRPDCLGAFLSDPRHVMFIACDRGTVVGMASGVEYFHPDKLPQFWINEVAVTPDLQGRGIGRRLTAALIDEAERRGCQYAWLGTAADNVSGRACFSSVPGAEAPQNFLLFEWDLED